MNPLIFLLGPSAAGKSLAAQKITESLPFPVEFVTSKTILGQLVLDHTRDVIPNAQGEIVTPHVTLRNPEWATPENFQAAFPDGHLLNLTHEGLIAFMAKKWKEQGMQSVLMTELANGEEKDYGPGTVPARQTAKQFIDWLAEHGVLDQSVALHITAPFEVRAKRNRERGGYIPDDQFAFLYGIDDFSPADAARFDGRYWRIDNGNLLDRELTSEVTAFVDTMLLPGFNKEGQRGDFYGRTR